MSRHYFISLIFKHTRAAEFRRRTRKRRTNLRSACADSDKTATILPEFINMKKKKNFPTAGVEKNGASVWEKHAQRKRGFSN